MEEPVLPTPATKKSSACPNCGCVLPDVSLPTKCTKCAFTIIELDPPWNRKPIGLVLRMWFVGWPLGLIVFGLALDMVIPPVGMIFVAVGYIAAFINSLYLLIRVSRMPRKYDDAETPDQRRRRATLMFLVTIGLALLIPVLLFGLCLMAFSAEVRRHSGRQTLTQPPP